MSDTRASAEIVKGSWEDLLLQAGTLADQDDEEAVPIFQKLVDRLSRLPAGQRMAADGRLNQLLFAAALQYTEFLNICGRYDDALAVITQVEPMVPEDEKAPWNRFAASIQLMAGKGIDGLERLRQLTQRAPEEEAARAWAEFALTALLHGELSSAQATVADLESWYNLRWGSQQTAPAARAAAAEIAYTKARIAVAQGENIAALAWFEHAMMLSEEYRENPHLMYPFLLDAGAHEEALALVRRDQRNSVRAGFWYGLIQRRLGNLREAERRWRKVIETELADDEEVDLLEWTLSHYYLGDQDGSALAGVLEAIRQSSRGEPGLFYLAALGWAQRGDQIAAVADLRQALKRRRAWAEGAALPLRWWHAVTDLADEPMQAALRDFFEPARSVR